MVDETALNSDVQADTEGVDDHGGVKNAADGSADKRDWGRGDILEMLSRGHKFQQIEFMCCDFMCLLSIEQYLLDTTRDSQIARFHTEDQCIFRSTARSFPNKMYSVT